MDSIEVVKIVGAMLAVALVVLLSRFITEQVYPEPEVAPHAYAVVPSAEPAAGEKLFKKCVICHNPDKDGKRKIGPNLWNVVAGPVAAAEPAAGEKLFKKCVACHNPDKDGKRKIGPNLWDVVERPVASAEGFAYSNALKEKSGETWSYDNLDAFLKRPKDWAPGTKMSFAGLKKPEQRAAVIAYLRSLSDSPAALPQ